MSRRRDLAGKRGVDAGVSKVLLASWVKYWLPALLSFEPKFTVSALLEISGSKPATTTDVPSRSGHQPKCWLDGAEMNLLRRVSLGSRVESTGPFEVGSYRRKAFTGLASVPEDSYVEEIWPWKASLPFFRMTLITPPKAPPYSASTPEVLMSTSWMNSIGTLALE